MTKYNLQKANIANEDAGRGDCSAHIPLWQKQKYEIHRRNTKSVKCVKYKKLQWNIDCDCADHPP